MRYTTNLPPVYTGQSSELKKKLDDPEYCIRILFEMVDQLESTVTLLSKQVAELQKKK